MPILSWDEKYSVGVKRIDDEHKTLIDLINKAYDSAKGTNDIATLKELTNDMRKYALMHFATETTLMKDYGFPDANTHLEEHKIFTGRITTAISHDETGQEIPDTNQLFRFLAKWLQDHLLKTDKEFGKYLNDKGMD